jgi:hypothetical protein
VSHTGDESTHYEDDGCNPPHVLSDDEGEGDDYTEPVDGDPRHQGQCRWWDDVSERCPILRDGDGPFCRAHAKRFNAILWFADIRVELPDAFFETDEPIDDVIAAWQAGEKVITAPPANRLADEAEQGYDPTTLRPRRQEGETR